MRTSRALLLRLTAVVISVAAAFGCAGQTARQDDARAETGTAADAAPPAADAEMVRDAGASTDSAPGTGDTASKGDGDTSTGGSCGPFTPCGGEVTGTWKVSSCTDWGSYTPPCPGYVRKGTPQWSGTMSFTSDGTYDFELLMTSSDQEMIYSAACLTQWSMTCEELNAQMTASSSVGSVVCTSTPAGDCDCAITGEIPVSTHGTYSVTDNVLTMIDGATGQSSSTDQYCVDGNTLTMRSEVSASGGSLTYVMTKQ